MCPPGWATAASPAGAAPSQGWLYLKPRMLLQASGSECQSLSLAALFLAMVLSRSIGNTIKLKQTEEKRGGGGGGEGEVRGSAYTPPMEKGEETSDATSSHHFVSASAFLPWHGRGGVRSSGRGLPHSPSRDCCCPCVPAWAVPWEQRHP